MASQFVFKVLARKNLKKQADNFFAGCVVPNLPGEMTRKITQLFFCLEQKFVPTITRFFSFKWHRLIQTAQS